MAGEIEAAGEAVTGGLLARAVEPSTGHMPHTAHGICRNCGTALAGDYCHACGQPGHLHRSLSAIGHDLAHGVLHFEGKIWRTLPMLVLRPGELTRRYIAGERARFVSPLALFLFSVFLMFALFSAFGAGIALPDDARVQANAELGRELREARSDIAALEQRRAQAARDGAPTAVLDQNLTERRAALSALERVTDGIANERVEIGTGTGWKRLDKGIAKAVANPNLLVYKLQANAYKFSWALIPLSVPFVWLLFFWRRDLHVYDHTVFVTYSLSFMSLLAIVLTLLTQLGVSSGLIGLLSAVVPPVHLVRHLRGAYRLGRRAALVKLAVLLIFAAFVIVLFTALLIGLGLLG